MRRAGEPRATPAAASDLLLPLACIDSVLLVSNSRVRVKHPEGAEDHVKVDQYTTGIQQDATEPTSLHICAMC